MLNRAEPLRNRSGWNGRFLDKPFGIFGGPGEIRTHDLFHAMEARSQLRHRPDRRDDFQYITRVPLTWSARRHDIR